MPVAARNVETAIVTLSKQNDGVSAFSDHGF